MRKEYDFTGARKNPFASQLKKQITIRLQDDHLFLKTVIPSRKATRDYMNQGEQDAED